MRGRSELRRTLQEVHALALAKSPSIVRYFSSWFDAEDHLLIQTELCTCSLYHLVVRARLPPCSVPFCCVLLFDYDDHFRVLSANFVPVMFTLLLVAVGWATAAERRAGA